MYLFESFAAPDVGVASGAPSARAPCVPLRTRCQLLLTDVRRNPLSEWFRRDDWKALGDYVDRLRSKTPMDLDEVQRRFDSGRYGAAGAVAFDGEAFRPSDC